MQFWIETDTSCIHLFDLALLTPAFATRGSAEEEIEGDILGGHEEG